MKNKAITLISLVITIVVLIILAGVGIYLSLGNNEIFTRAKQAKESTNKQTATEIINLKITTAQMNKYTEEQRMPTLKELSVTLGNDNEIQYVTEKSQIASTKYEVGDNPSSIYTKLNNYPYEFEINGQLQLASINGIKIGNSITEIDDKFKVKNITYDAFSIPAGGSANKQIDIDEGYELVSVTPKIDGPNTSYLIINTGNDIFCFRNTTNSTVTVTSLTATILEMKIN